MQVKMRMMRALALLSLLASLSLAQKRWADDPAKWSSRVPDQSNTKACSNMTQVLDNWKFAIMTQVKDMLVNDHSAVLPEYGRIKPLSDALGDLYQQFNTLKENLGALGAKFDRVEAFVDDLQAGKFPKLKPRPRLPAQSWADPKWPLRRPPGARIPLRDAPARAQVSAPKAQVSAPRAQVSAPRAQVSAPRPLRMRNPQRRPQP
ncbi:uncharacterized protein LOC134435226 [Engraulis encrasicolus]|uniref:uncharacterized protein LOC134435226 n=1 Tax=Engraulis encrasicolus TaxID=184585 RepID=UPI002FCFE3BE